IITYTDGAYAVYKVEAIKEATGCNNKLFEDHLFAYCEDLLLSLKLWNKSYKIVTLPIFVGKHYRSASFAKIKPL
ncbi:MAG: hypothetical protein RMJ00_06140, partial [Nitrososphaerota archaeon]|nr:hypothetical protein [Candidatus Bathyarchaeota archaeon]MDW8062259.1 hypothetical protein [Nitrososphaerota archaeon]